LKDEVAVEASENLRQQAAQLRTRLGIVPSPVDWMYRRFGFVPPRQAVLDATTDLIYLSNALVDL
jgi:hypothetical protein